MQVFFGAHTSVLLIGCRVLFPRVMSGAVPVVLPLYAIMA